MIPFKLGWMRDLPDFRDYTLNTPAVKAVTSNAVAPKVVPTTMDLRKWCTPIEDQGQLGSCTANAAAGLLEYFENKAFGKYTNASRLFIYKATRNLLRWQGDTGAYLRSTMQSLAYFGAPEELYWPYDITKFDVEPSAFCYAFAENYKALTYYRLDPPGTALAQVLANVKNNLINGLPSMFGFTVYSSISNSPEIPFPKTGDQVAGGHAIMAVGFNDDHPTNTDKGALLIRNSWGTSWGTAGYGWLPYKYILSGLATDFWSLVKADYVDSSLFK